MTKGSKIFVPNRGLGYVSNHIPLQVRYIKSRKENLIITCVGKSFHTYGISHFGLLSVSSLHPSDIEAMTADAYHVYTSCGKTIYAWRRGTELKHTYQGHKDNIHLMLPFGAHLLSIDNGNELRVWDIKSEAVQLQLNFDLKVFKITTILHPSTYVNKILLGSEQGSMQLWNLSTAKLIFTFPGWGCAVSCLEQAPALDVAAIGLDNGKILLHNLKFDETVMEFQQDWGAITSISFRTDGHPIMATGSPLGHIVFWDLEQKRVASQLLSAHKDTVNGMVCLPSEPLVITSSADNSLKLWIFDMTDGGARLLRIREGHAMSPISIRFHGSNGHNIISAGGDSTLRIFNTQTEQFNKSLGRASYNRKSSKKRGRLIDDPLTMPPIIQFTSETTREKEWDNIACVHQGLPMVTTWSYDKLKMGELKLLPERLHKKTKNLDEDVNATSLCLTHCGNFVLVGYSSGHVDRFNVQSGLWRTTYGNPKAHDQSVRGIATDGLNQVAVTGGSDATIKFWKFKNKSGENALTTIQLDESVLFMRAHHESSMIAVALDNYTIQVIDIDTRSVVRKFPGHSAQLTDATFSPDARWLVTSAMDCIIRTWDMLSAQLVDQFRTEMACISLDFSPTSEALVTAHIGYLGMFLWTNRALYQRITLKAQNLNEEPELVSLPEVTVSEIEEKDDEIDDDIDAFKSPEQISHELITLSGLSNSRWQNLLDIDIIKRKNKPRMLQKVPKSAPFFLPTIPSLNLQFATDKPDTTNGSVSKLFSTNSLTNFTEFGKALNKAKSSDDFDAIVTQLKLFGPSMIDHEIKSLCPDEGGSILTMLQFLKCIEYMLKSNCNFELAQAYLAVFLKTHGVLISQESELRDYLPNIQSCAQVSWNRLQEKLMYNLCVVEHVKNLI